MRRSCMSCRCSVENRSLSCLMRASEKPALLARVSPGRIETEHTDDRREEGCGDTPRSSSVRENLLLPMNSKSSSKPESLWTRTWSTVVVVSMEVRVLDLAASGDGLRFAFKTLGFGNSGSCAPCIGGRIVRSEVRAVPEKSSLSSFEASGCWPYFLAYNKFSLSNCSSLAKTCMYFESPGPSLRPFRTSASRTNVRGATFP
mmetsp:Transcript_62834/g.148808  ORF Transcript_62834/g.148808 Transcript_62834/m.148808 type:complete len:202 (-) Transcript_62834:430-1035(-)